MNPILNNEKYVAKRRETNRRWRTNNKEKRRIYNQKHQYQYLKKYLSKPEAHAKLLARRKFKYAIKMGKIRRQICEVTDCGIIGEGHHDDYLKPLEVRWLCKKHHTEYHYPLL